MVLWTIPTTSLWNSSLLGLQCQAWNPHKKLAPCALHIPNKSKVFPLEALWSDFIFSVSRNLQPMCWKHFRTQFGLIHVEPTAIKCFASRLGFVPLVSRTIGKDTMSLISSLDRIPSSPSAATPPNTLDIHSVGKHPQETLTSFAN